MSDIRSKNDAELMKLLGEKRKTLRLFRFGIAGSRTKNTKEGVHTRKDIARILTEIGARMRDGA